MALVTPPSRFEVYLVATDASGAGRPRPCVIVSPDEANKHLSTVIVAPMTTLVRRHPTRVALRFRGKAGQVVLDQIRAVEKVRLVKRLGEVPARTAPRIAAGLVEMFAL